MVLNGIHPTALIAEGAKIAENVSIGPYTIIGENVEIEKDNVILMLSLMGIRQSVRVIRFFPFVRLELLLKI